MNKILSRRDIDFLLYEWLGVDALLHREPFTSHDREVFNAVLDLSEEIATQEFAAHNKKGDNNEPYLDGGLVYMVPEIKASLDAFIASGLLSAAKPAHIGGMQLPTTIEKASGAFFMAANPGVYGYLALTIAAANLLLTHGNADQVQRFARPMIEGRFFGTMCLSESQAGSSLSDITTRAEPQADGTFRLFGSKMWISGGEHSLSETIVHLVLARIPDAPVGVKGISLFIVPRDLVAADGSLAQRNDVSLVGLNHKMGQRGTVNCALGFGEGFATPDGRPGAVGYLVMLLAQKCYVEGGLALNLYCARLVDEQISGDARGVERAGILLDLLTPLAKSWPSQWGLKANDLAIQIHGGYGYTRDYMVEQFYRDNRLNAIHEGTHGIQALDLLGRKVLAQPGSIRAFAQEIENTAHAASARANAELANYAQELLTNLARLLEVTDTLANIDDRELALANATIYLEAFGHLAVAWIWLQQSLAADGKAGRFYDGKRAAARYFFRNELPKLSLMFDLLINLERTAFDCDPACL